MSTKLFKEKELPINLPQGPNEYLLEHLEKLGIIPVDIQIQILQEKRINILRNWFNLINEAKSVEQFIKGM